MIASQSGTPSLLETLLNRSEIKPVVHVSVYHEILSENKPIRKISKFVKEPNNERDVGVATVVAGFTAKEIKILNSGDLLSPSTAPNVEMKDFTEDEFEGEKVGALKVIKELGRSSKISVRSYIQRYGLPELESVEDTLVSHRIARAAWPSRDLASKRGELVGSDTTFEKFNVGLPFQHEDKRVIFYGVAHPFHHSAKAFTSRGMEVICYDTNTKEESYHYRKGKIQDWREHVRSPDEDIIMSDVSAGDLGFEPNENVEELYGDMISDGYFVGFKHHLDLQAPGGKLHAIRKVREHNAEIILFMDGPGKGVNSRTQEKWRNNIKGINYRRTKKVVNGTISLPDKFFSRMYGEFEMAIEDCFTVEKEQTRKCKPQSRFKFQEISMQKRACQDFKKALDNKDFLEFHVAKAKDMEVMTPLIIRDFVAPGTNAEDALGSLVAWVILHDKQKDVIYDETIESFVIL